AADELRASLAQQPAAPSETVNVLGMPEFDGLLDHIYEYGTAAEGVIEKANAFARAVIARYAPQQPAAAQPQPKRRPYNASGSLGEYGVFPECDAALDAATPPSQESAMDKPLPEAVVEAA